MPDPTFKIDSTTVLSKSGTTVSVDSGLNIKPAFSALDSSATNGPTSGTAITKSTTLPIFACRAWVSFNGSSVDGSNNCAINASGNISKVVRFGTGQFDVYFETAMPDINYVMVGSGFYGSGAGTYMGIVGIYNNANFSDSVFTTYIKIAQTGHDGTNINCEGTTIAFFR